MPVEIEPHRRGLVRTVQLLVGDRVVADEIVTQVYTAFPHEWDVAEGLPAETWLYRAAVRRVRGWVEAGNRFPTSGPGGPVAGVGGGALVAGLGALPLPQREAVVLTETALEPGAVAAALDVPAGEAQARAASGQAALLARLAERFPWLRWALQPDPEGTPPRSLRRRWALALLFFQLDWWSGGPIRSVLQGAAAVGGGIAAGLGIAAFFWSMSPPIEPPPIEDAEPETVAQPGTTRPPPPPPLAAPDPEPGSPGSRPPAPARVPAGCSPAPEIVCDGVDQDCDGADLQRDGFVDADGDGFGGAAEVCGAVERGGDCDDADPAVQERCEAAVAVAPPPAGTLAEQNAAYAVVVAARDAGSWAVVAAGAEDYRGRFPDGAHVDLAWMDSLEAAVHQGRHAEVVALAERLDERPGLADKRPEIATRRAEALVELGRCGEALELQGLAPKALRRLEDRCRTR